MAKLPNKGSIGKRFRVCKGKFLRKDFAEGFQGGSPQLTVQKDEHSLRFRMPKVLAERRLSASRVSQCNSVAKQLSRAFCERLERERPR